MSNIVNPMDSLPSFQYELEKGNISLQKGEIDHNLYVHLDKPEGHTRFTYVRLDENIVTAMAIIVLTEPYEGKP